MADEPQLVLDNEWEDGDDILCDLDDDPPAMMFGGKFTIIYDPPDVILEPGVDWTGAAKFFWNEVFRMVGKPPPFDW